MGILDSIAQQSSPTQEQMPVEQSTQSNMGQMYQMLMENSIAAISQTVEKTIQEKGPIEGTAYLIATAMISNLQAARQNNKTIPPQVMLQVAKDIGMNLLQQLGVPEDQFDDVLIDVLLRAIEFFGDMSDGMIPPEEEQQYIDMIKQISQAEQQRQSQKQGNPVQVNQGEQGVM